MVVGREVGASEGGLVPIVAVDPGTTTGIAVRDRNGRFWAGQVGPKGDRKYSVQSGKHDWWKGRADIKRIYILELEQAKCIMEIILALGPGGFIVVEDFILGVGRPGSGGSMGGVGASSKREGISPARVTAALEMGMDLTGITSGGVAWRNGGVAGDGGGVWQDVRTLDQRGWIGSGGRVVTSLGGWNDRLALLQGGDSGVEGGRSGVVRGVGGDWRGFPGGAGSGAWSLHRQSPSDAKGICTDKKLVEIGAWRPASGASKDVVANIVVQKRREAGEKDPMILTGREHARDAMRHLYLFLHGLGDPIQDVGAMRLIWNSNKVKRKVSR